MKVVHVSDTHSRTYKLPGGDLYVFTGDILPDFVTGQMFNLSHDRPAQRRWVNSRRGTYRSAFGIGTQPVICVRGNHDWNNLSSLFGGEVYEAEPIPTVITVKGLKIGLVRGVTSCGGFWSDEKHDNGDFGMDQIPYDINMLLTHCPPAGILDKVVPKIRIGSQEIANWLSKRSYSGVNNPLTHCFGHVHEDYGVTTNAFGQFSNAACHYNVLEVK